MIYAVHGVASCVIETYRGGTYPLHAGDEFRGNDATEISNTTE